VTAAIGVARLLSARPTVAAITAAATVWCAAVPIRIDPPLTPDTYVVGDALDVLQREPADLRAYQLQVLAERQSLGSHRALPVDGLGHVTALVMLDAIGRAAGPEERIGWIGVSSVLSPAMLQLGLLSRGGSRARFLRDAEPKIDLDYFVDPRVDAAGVRAFAADFDVIFATDPPDMKGRRDRVWAAQAREWLLQDGSWTARQIGRFEIERPLKEPLVVTLFACRRKK
jgi:hypothetical protein